MYHSIIVGYGLAGLCYAFQLKKRNRPFLIIDHPSINGASQISSGLCNPFNFKRLTLAWRAPEFFLFAKEFFQSYEKQISGSLFKQMPIYKRLTSAGEINQWSVKYNQPFFKSFFDAQIHKSFSPIGPHGHYGVIHNTFQIDLQWLFKSFLQTIDSSYYVKETFNSNELKMDHSQVKYKRWTSQHIVFCQGYGLKSNPLTRYLPLIGNKGERLVIRSDAIPTDKILKSKCYVIPRFKKHQFWVGATFDRHSKSVQTTSKSKQQLIDDLKQIFSVDYQIISHQSQIRPTVIDRRPLLGKIPNHKRAFVFNGLGIRGIMMAPLLSKWLYHYIEKGVKLPEEVSIDRFNQFH
ncbi:MAG: FAD-dependent oxidoreductase [Flavobacteriaceae bacterium]|nr:FAD-dependent oxidoreductase [Flavobacteriaceae bacterium]